MQKKCHEIQSFLGKITNEMGYWVDMENPYMTYDNNILKVFGGF